MPGGNTRLVQFRKLSELEYERLIQIEVLLFAG